MSTLVLYLSGRGRISYLPLIFADLIYYFDLIMRTIEHELAAKPPAELRHLSDQQLRDIGLSKANAALVNYGLKPHIPGNRCV